MEKNKSSLRPFLYSKTPLFHVAFVCFIPVRGARCLNRFPDQLWATFWIKHNWGFPNILRIYSTHGKGKGTTTCHLNIKKKNQNKFPEKCWILYNHHNGWGIYTSLTGLNRDYWQVYISMSQLCISPSVPLTCLFVRLLVWPDNGAEVGEDKCAESAGSFLLSTVVVKRVLAQHKPVSTLLDPISSHLQQEPPFKTRHIHKSYSNCYTRQQKWDKCLSSKRQFLKHLLVTNFLSC